MIPVEENHKTTRRFRALSLLFSAHWTRLCFCSSSSCNKPVIQIQFNWSYLFTALPKRIKAGHCISLHVLWKDWLQFTCPAWKVQLRYIYSNYLSDTCQTSKDFNNFSLISKPYLWIWMAKMMSGWTIWPLPRSQPNEKEIFTLFSWIS